MKLERTRQAAHLLAEHPDALPEGEAARLLWEMASKLNCLTQYAVGPAFDQQAPGPAPVLEELPRVILPPPPAPAAL